MRPRYVFEIARFTLLEAVSRRLILAGVVISLGFIGLFALGFHFAYDRSLETSATAEARSTHSWRGPCGDRSSLSGAGSGMR